MEEKHVLRLGDRNYGIDLLRLVSMFMVVVLHVLGRGGVLSTAKGNEYNAAWLLEITCYCAVDCFALITGYVYVDKTYKISRYFSTWVQVSFYSITISLISFLVQRSIGVGLLAFSILPVFSQKYWYFTAYTGLYLLIPVFNKYIQTTNEKMLDYTVVSILAYVSIFSPLSKYMFGGDLLNLNDGYSFVWMSLLYIVGAWLKKRAGTFFKSKWIYIGTVFLIVATWLIKIINHGNEYLKDIMISYCSPTIIWIAIFLTIAFARIRLGKSWKKIVAILSPSAFSVYLIHVHPIIWNELMKDRFSWIGEKTVMVEVTLVVCTAFCIFIACLLIDIVIRKPVFSLLKVNSHIEKMVGRIEKKYQ